MVHYLNDILMLELPQKFHFTYGGHIKAVLELSHFDLLNSHLASGG